MSDASGSWRTMNTKGKSKGKPKKKNKPKPKTPGNQSRGKASGGHKSVGSTPSENKRSSFQQEKPAWPGVSSTTSAMGPKVKSQRGGWGQRSAAPGNVWRQAAPKTNEEPQPEPIRVFDAAINTPIKKKHVDETTGSPSSGEKLDLAEEDVVWADIRTGKKITPLIGTIGKKVNLITNRVILESIPRKISVFHFAFTEDEDKKSKTKTDLTKFIDFANQPIAYDGSKIVVQYGVASNEGSNQIKSVHDDNYVLEKLNSLLTNNSARVTLDSREDKVLNGSGENLTPVDFQYLDIILTKNLPKAVFKPIQAAQSRGGPQRGVQGRTRKDPDAETLDLKFRFRASLVRAKGGLQVSLDVQGSVVYKKMTLLDHLMKRGLMDRNGRFTKRREYVTKDLEGLKIRANQRAAENVVKVKDFTDEACGRLKTDLINGRVYTVAQYFKETYNINVNPNLPCVRTSLTKKIFYPLECVDVVVEQRFDREIPRAAVKDVHLPPAQRNVKILQGMKETGKSLERSSGQEMKLGPNVIKVTGREIGTTMARRNEKFFNPKAIKNWVVAVADRRAEERNMKAMVTSFIKAGRQYGMSISQPQIIAVNNSQDMKNQLKRYIQQGLEFVLLVKGEQDKTLYNVAKKFSWIETGVPIQVCLSKHFKYVDDRKLSAYMSNLLLKVNVKMGGSNFKFARGVKDLPPKCLILGLDVSHGMLNVPVGSELPSQATAAMIAFDPVTNDMRSSFTNQHGRNDVLKEETYLTLLKDLNINFNRYSSVIMYRDGVGDSMFGAVSQQECATLIRFLGEKVKVTFLVFTKRHKTRFFRVQGNEVVNPNAGTVVDQVVTNEGEFDFYLQAHKCGIGSARLPHYTVLHNDLKLNADQLQVITNQLSSLYQRSFGPVSQTCAAYYAHILADKCRFLMDHQGKFPPLNARLLATSPMYFL